LCEKAQVGVDVRVMMNFNPSYESSIIQCNNTKALLERHNISVKYLYTNWSIFTNLHNKGVIVDNTSVLISSINWNEHSVTQNREAGVIIDNEDVATWYATVFLHDWQLSQPSIQQEESIQEQGSSIDQENMVYIVVVFIATFAIIIHDWRKREWT
jgi:phosphatidylserine/phosphatidylglycerophosphate/cardiolipin synthase-like enzyme